MPYTHTNSKVQPYHVHSKDVTLQNGRSQRIDYFAREPKRGEVIDALPPGHRIEENPRIGLPYLKRAQGRLAPAASHGRSRSAKPRWLY